MLPRERSSPDSLFRIRHSLAHVLAQAVVSLRSGAKRGFGPPTDQGFYYDFLLPDPVTPADFSLIEDRMAQIIRENQAFVREEYSAEDAVRLLLSLGEPLKAAYAEELAAKHSLRQISFYRNGPFIDMCRGPHVVSTSELPIDGFKLRSVAGACWRGDSQQPMLTRIAAWCFSSREELDQQVARYEARVANDHKRLGAALDIYVLDPIVGKGLPLWLPNGTAIREELEKLAREEEFRRGYVRVATPHITRGELYRQSGHLELYRDRMFPPMTLVDDSPMAGNAVDQYFLKPMNCPHHHRIFAARPRSYRDLPLRLTEYGHVYRYESSGEISGLLRVRGMSMNDAHIYCTKEQIKDEIKAALDLQAHYFQLFGFADYDLRLSLWDPLDPQLREKYVNNPALWAETEAILRDALIESGQPYREATGEAAFYGPKIDVQFKMVTGREETFSTVQLDFAVPASDRMNLTYVGSDGKPAHPFVIHRAPLATHERFVAFLLEHFAGAFPSWLAPVQVAVLPISEKFNDYASKVHASLRSELVRAELDLSSTPLGHKVRDAELMKVPYLIILGAREVTEEVVTVRVRGKAAQSRMRLGDFQAGLHREIAARSPVLAVLGEETVY